MKIFNEKILKNKDKVEPKAAPSATTSAAHQIQEKKSPIIVFPSGFTTLVNVFNAGKFLSGKYEEPDKNYEQTVEYEQFKQNKFFVYARNRTQQYKIIDDPKSLQEKDWDRVVAVFVTGQLWQFKDWKHVSNGKPVDLFQKILGVHVTVDGRTPPPIISSWNCKILKVIDKLLLNNYHIHHQIKQVY